MDSSLFLLIHPMKQLLEKLRLLPIDCDQAVDPVHAVMIARLAQLVSLFEFTRLNNVNHFLLE